MTALIQMSVPYRYRPRQYPYDIDNMTSILRRRHIDIDHVDIDMISTTQTTSLDPYSPEALAENNGSATL